MGAPSGGALEAKGEVVLSGNRLHSPMVALSSCSIVRTPVCSLRANGRDPQGRDAQSGSGRGGDAPSSTGSRAQPVEAPGTSTWSVENPSAHVVSRRNTLEFPFIDQLWPAESIPFYRLV